MFTKALRVYQPRRIDLMPKCSIEEFCAWAAVLHHDQKGHMVLMHCVVLKGLPCMVVVNRLVHVYYQFGMS